MGLQNFQVTFDSPTNAYYAGTNVTGRVDLVIDKPKKVRGKVISGSSDLFNLCSIKLIIFTGLTDVGVTFRR